MFIDILSTLEKVITTDNYIKSVIPVYDSVSGRLAIFSGMAPEGTPYPYLVIGSTTDPQSLVSNIMSYTVDIYDKNASPKSVADIGERIQSLLFNLDTNVNVKDCVRPQNVTLGIGNGIIPDPDLSMQHFHTSFYVKYDSSYLYK